MAETDATYRAAIAELQRLCEQAVARGDREVRSAALATSTPDGRPSVRTVNIARLAESGLAFFVQTNTGKGQQLAANPRAALCFHWPVLEYQVIVEGAVVPLSAAESDALWRRIPREAGVGHWASDQTAEAASTAEAQKRAQSYRRQFEAERVPLAPGWIAYELNPDRIDFWPTGWQRLRARERYEREAGGTWRHSREGA